MTGKDSLTDVGTGFSKTFCMIIPCLLVPESLAVIYSPLKRLLAVQVLEFERHGIKTVAINEDTPSDPALWKVSRSGIISFLFYVNMNQKIGEGKFLALLVQPEQLRTIIRC